MEECWLSKHKFYLANMLIIVSIISAKSYSSFLEKGQFLIEERELLIFISSLDSGRGAFPVWTRPFSTGSRSIPQEYVDLFSNLYKDQGAMLEYVRERGSHPQYDRRHNTFTHHIRRNNRGNTRNVVKPLDKNGPEKTIRRKMAKRSLDKRVFLGGSCNPTTWRRDVAIPLLENLGISYFNPQVAEWTEDLITVEHNAKETASVLFYVLDRRTRNVVGIVELANFVGSQRDVVLVADPYKEGEPVAGETISCAEYEELCSGLSTLHDLLNRQGINVYKNITEAIDWTAKILNSTPSPRRKTSLKISNCIHDGSLKKSGEVISNTGKGEFNLSNVLDFISSKKITDLNGIPSKVFGFGSNDVRPPYDIYVEGSCFDQEWKENIALPILRESKLKFVLPGCGSVNGCRSSGREVCPMENSKVLLFIISNKTRGLSTMALASYFIGCRKNVVLCIQNLTEDTVIGGEQLSKTSMKDYNRGRAYLTELATRAGAPVYEKIDEAIYDAISRSNTTKSSLR